MSNKKTKISHAFQRWLVILVAIAFLATTAFLWLIQTRLSENNAISLLKLNLSDVREDIIDASDENLLKLTHSIAADINMAASPDSALLVRHRNDLCQSNLPSVNPPHRRRVHILCRRPAAG